MSNASIIAIVDDDASVRRSLERLVQSAGYTVATFGSAREYLAWLRNGHAACLVLDVHMNEMSGFELQARLTAPIIFITAQDDATTRDRLEKTRSAHLRKPFDDHVVLDAIRRAIGEAAGGPLQ